MTGHSRFDGAGREVLAVDPDPLGGASGEVEVALLVEVTQCATPVPAVARAPGVGLVVVVVALERPRSGSVHDLAHALLRVDELAVSIETGSRTGVALVVDNLHR